MKKLMSVATSFAASLAAATIGFAAPAQAAETAVPNCRLLMPITAEDVTYCACLTLVWATSPVIPPENWDCNPPG